MRTNKVLLNLLVIGTAFSAQVAAGADPNLRGYEGAPPTLSPTVQPALAPDVGFVVTTTDTVDGYRVRRYLGVVRGVMVREPTRSESFKANLKGIVGGKISPYMRMCETARQGAYDQMIERAKASEANAIIGMRYDSSSFEAGSDDIATEVVCYGTAVLLEPLR